MGKKCSAHTAARAGVKAKDWLEPLNHAVASDALSCPEDAGEHNGRGVSSSNVMTPPTFGIASGSDLEHSVGPLYEVKPLISPAS